MALPGMQAHYPRRDMGRLDQERLIVQRRAREANQRSAWTGHSNYFRAADVRSAKSSQWTSEQCFDDSLRAYESRFTAEEKQQRLAERQAKLSNLLAAERDMYEAELKGNSGKHSEQYLAMKDRVDELQRKREEERRQLAEAKLQQHFDENCRELRQVESRQMQRDVEQTWSGQQEEKQKRRMEEEVERQRYHEERERERKFQQAEHEARERSRQSDRKAVAEELQTQIRRLKMRDEEAAKLKRQQQDVQKERQAIIEAEDERRKMDERHRQAEYGRQLTRQFKAQLRRKSRLVQEQLELDMEILDRLMKEDQEVAAIQTARRETAKSDVAWMKEVVEQQLAVEREREEEMELLYREEAEREWKKHELQWQREREARERLMKQVFDERQTQLGQKLQELQQQQAESVEERERLLEDIAVAEQMTARESKQEASRRQDRELQLATQMRDVQHRALLEREMEELDLQEDQLAEAEYSARVQDRLTARATQPYAQKSYGRRRAAWN